jgi:hypothetical protein
MVRTGPARRQRIGDVAAGTTVIAVDGRAAERGTPGWMLPAATLFAVAVSALSVYGIAEAGKQPLSGAQTADFISGCQRTAGPFVDCGCILNQLEAHGYVTFNNLAALANQYRSEVLLHQPGLATRTITDAALTCRH